MSTPTYSDLILVERGGTIYKCTHEDFWHNHRAKCYLVICMSRFWTYTGGTEGTFLGHPSGMMYYHTDDYYELALSQTCSSYLNHNNYSIRPSIQVYSNNLDNAGTSGWSKSFTSDAYYNSTYNAMFTSPYKKSVVNIWVYTPEEVAQGVNATSGTFSKIRWWMNQGTPNAMYGGNFMIGWKVYDGSIAGNNMNEYSNFGGSAGGSNFVQFADEDSPNGSVLSNMQYGNQWIEVTATDYNISWY